MTWHLKDRELEKKLIGIAPDFVESLNESLKLGEYEENSWTYRVWFGPYEDCYKFEMHVYDDELEDVPEYNPNGWNEFPAVTPPDSRVCQLMVSHSLDEPIKYFAAFYDFRAKTWRVQDSGRQIDTKVLKDGFVTFRAWRD